MKYFIILFLYALLLASCCTTNTITIANENVYYDTDAFIAYDIYYTLYENNVCDKKPLLITINKKCSQK